MARKKLVTQELVNRLPEWTDVRKDEQSVGHSLVNVIADGLESLTEENHRGYHNMLLTTANVAEIDQVYIFGLPNIFEFEVDDPNQLVPLKLSPTVSGQYNGTWYNLEEIDEGDIKSFWYDALPTRLSSEVTPSGEQVTYSGLNFSAAVLDSFTDEYQWDLSTELDIPNNLLVRITEGNDFYFEQKNSIHRAKVRITGVTWKDTVETEELFFLYNEDQRTKKIWKEIVSIEAIDFQTQARIEVFALDCGTGHYSDPYQDRHQYVESRNTMSRFWDLQDSTTISGVKLLVSEKYSGNTVDELLLNQSAKVPHRSWELVDVADNPLDILDIEPIPFSRYCYAVTASGLHVYDLDFDIPSTSITKNQTRGALVKIEASNDYPIRDEEVGVDFIFQRPIKTIHRHRVQILYPDGSEYGVALDGSLVSLGTDHWIYDNGLDNRFIRPTTFFQFTDYGNHILTVEVTYVDGVTETIQRILTCERKQALRTFDITALATNVVSLGMDHLQNIYVVDSTGNAFMVNLHYDVILIDYENKDIICREPYDEVKVLKE